MDRPKKFSSCIGFLALLGALTACAPVKPHPYRIAFLPPSPKPLVATFVTPDPPVLGPRGDAKTASLLLALTQPPAGPGRAEALAREADWHFQLGRKHYQEGDEAGARREFDRAIDILLSGPDGAAFRAVLDPKLDELVEIIHRLDLAGLGSGEVGEPQFEKPPLEDIPQMTFPIDPKMKNRVLEEVRATVSQLPLQVNNDVLAYIHYFSSERGHKILVSGLRRAGRYRPLIQRIFDEEGVPQELIFLAQAESGFLPRAVSRKKATGMWQFVLFRGRQYGLEQSPYSDDRLDPEKATRAAARHLRDLYGHYGDWYLAIAAYNCGPGVVDRAVERTGYADFWELRRRNVLPKETANHVPIILAMTIMAKNPQEYGLEDVDSDPALAYDTLEITAPTSLLLLADLAECPVSQIRDLNPALLKTVTPAGWRLRVPRGTATELGAVLNTIPAAKRCCWRAHRVGEGETLAAIARRYRVAEGSIAAVNSALDGTLKSGALLVIPAAAQPEPKATGKRSARRRALQPKAAPRRASAGQSRTHSQTAQRKAGSGTYSLAKSAARKQATVKR